MEAFAFLAPLAFVFAIAALTQSNQLKKEVERLKKDLEALEQKVFTGK